MILKFFILYFYFIFILTSILGYGYLLANFLNKEILKYNLGYIGILGLLSLVLISYSTTFIFKHGYIHNIIVHAIGLISFIFFLYKLKLKKNYFRIIILFLIMSSALFILKNHDDFSYYHLTYSLGLTENKIQMGLGNLEYGYRHHSSLFFLNSLIFLPFIKFYLFHSIGLITLIFVNFICLSFLTNKNELKKFNYIYFLYLMIFIYVNVKFYRIGGYGTDIAAQIIVLSLIPQILITLKNDINKIDFKSNLQIVILTICYLITVKSYFILYSVFLILLFVLFYKKKYFIDLFFYSRTTIIAFLTLIFFSLVNLSYTGCVLYPLKETCLDKQLSWTISKKEVQRMKIWYEGWAKGASSPTHRTKDTEEYIKGFKWFKGWIDVYFFNKGLENLLSILFLPILLSIIFYRNQKNYKNISYKNLYKVLFVVFLLLCEWLYKHPTLRYGGYSLIATFIFFPFSLILSKPLMNMKKKKQIVTSLIIITLLIFNLRNFVRIDKEVKNNQSDSFPYFYVPKGNSKLLVLNENINIYIPQNINACWATKTPCAGGADGLKTKKKLGFNIFKRNNW